MNQVENILNRIAALADGLKLANLRPQISACRNLLHARNVIDVAVFGRFKAGKSSFLNDLTGRAVLPIGVVPLTAVITPLRYFFWRAFVFYGNRLKLQPDVVCQSQASDFLL